jgi:TrmH family RNA methyltransferase
MNQDPLTRIRFVLVQTSHPGNIGASARAMKTMGLRALTLVAPERYPSAEATARASGADDLLARAGVVSTLDEALAGCRWVAGASARLRRIPVPAMNPRNWAARAVREARAGDVALVLGREQSGLSNAELDRCHALVHIPSNPDYGSLNLAAAVQVLAYELRMAVGGDLPREVGEETPVATARELEGLYAHLEEALVELEFLDPDNPKQLLRRLRRLFHRARPDQNELNILRGILTAAQKAKRGQGGA